ncbi:hypothetical protein [Arthrobacter sp. JUb115]|uniref:hypothetical protein n=1 Tax=Arthrobacter sp. JUb115 TaxID=2485108 RepID=UPI001061D71A|nr:hypothetical protein [Arthrobacter sp. JUb115]TDU27112.1 hypothetical protein EDF61_104188 [Arthrobacter sp. JUb115]
MDGPQFILALIAALGGGATLREIFAAIGRVRSGKTKTERTQNKNLVARAHYAEAMHQFERDFRLQVQDAASLWRRLAIEYGADAAELGPWPVPPDPPKRPEDDPDTSTI